MPRWTTIAGHYIRERLESSGTTAPANTTDVVVQEKGFGTFFVEDGAANGVIGYAKALTGANTTDLNTGMLGAEVRQPELLDSAIDGTIGCLAETLTTQGDEVFAKVQIYGYMYGGCVHADVIEFDLLVGLTGTDTLDEPKATYTVTERRIGIALDADGTSPLATNFAPIFLFAL